ncbi:MAG: hypothetical protein KIB53_02125 [Paraclostridium bifermentans]|uniref:hypothetical protein n=1 Tax=Paraclostridium bifermentans TaxID=1490 RepID=UPI00241DF8F7|nr:hypothetical protein [Paraclostridium bifermentans]MBS5952587.1 hypothetical protein [Paraclostridium bifermentans]
MFTIDFTKPWLYKDIIYFNQGNLSTNNTLRCKLITGGSDDFTGGSIACTFTTKDSVEIDGFGKLIDAKSGIVDIVIPSNALVVGVNKLEILVNRLSGGTAQSPAIKYEVWQGLTTGSGVEAETNYPILIELINSTNEVSNKANSALSKANSMIADASVATDNAYMSANAADIAASKANESVDNVNKAIAAGTKDLEVKEARKDASGVTYDTLKQMLDANLGIEGKTLKDFVIDMNGMKETQDLAYETDKGYLVCNDTQTGVVKDLRISGKSLVNVTNGDLPKQGSCTFESIIATSTQRELKVTKEGSCVIMRRGVFKRNTDYTIIAKVKYISSVNDLSFSFKQIDGSYTISQTNVKKNNTSEYADYVVKLNTSNYDIESIVIGYHASLPIDSILGVKDVLVLESDYARNPPQYFEGIASVGNGNEIEVSSVKSDGNLFDGELRVSHLEGGTNIYREDTVNTLSAIIKIPCGGTYYCKCEDGNRNSIAYFKSKPQKGDLPLKAGADTITVDSGGYLVFYMTNQSNVLYPKNIMVNFGNIAKPYITHKQYRKPILFKDIDNTWKPVTELRGINENKCDTIEEHSDNRHYKHERILKTVLNGTEQWNLISTATSDTIRCYILGNGKYIPNDNKNILADKISKYDTASLTDNCIGIDSNGNIVVGIKKSELTTQDVDGVKAYLVKNNITLLSVMPNEKVYEVNPLDLESYSNETMILFGSGVIAPYASFRITSSLPNFLQNVEDRVCRLENEVYKMNLANFAVALNTLDVKARLEALEAPIN